LPRQSIGNHNALRNRGTAVGDLKCVGEIGALIYRLRRGGLNNADVGLRGSSDDGENVNDVIAGVWIADSTGDGRRVFDGVERAGRGIGIHFDH
jgi:hypothetical protein